MTLEPIKIAVEAEVDRKSVDKVIDAAVDLFSPVTESFGLLGDAVRWARVAVAVQVTRTAKRLADEQELVLTAPPLKFLAPFYEKCSLEDEGATDVQETWARLLLSAGANYDPVLPTYVDILSRLGPVEVAILKEMCAHWQVDTETYRAFETMMEYREVFASIVTALTSVDDKKERLEKAIQENTGLAGRRVLRAFLMSGAGGGTIYHTNAYRGRERSYDVLERERLIFVDGIEGSPPDTAHPFAGMMRPKIFVAQPTAIGFDLVRRCQ